MKLYELICVAGQNRDNCPYRSQGAYCVECSNARYKPRTVTKKEEEKQNEVEETPDE
jgi:hypothetical protein